MHTKNPFPLLASETALESLLDDLEVEVGEAVVYRLRASGTYHHFMGYACEAYLGDVQLAGSDPLHLNKRDHLLLAKLIRQADARRQDGSYLAHLPSGHAR